LTFTTSRNGPYQIYWIPVNGSNSEDILLTSSNARFADSWSPDGKVLLFDTAGDISCLYTEDMNNPRPYLHEPYDEYNAIFSPDGRWIAYESQQEESQIDVYVTPFPGSGEKVKVSTNGGYDPVWSPDGRELFYRNGDKMMVVAVDTNSLRFEIVKPPEILFKGQYLEDLTTGLRNYDISSDGQRFVMIKEIEEQSVATQLIVVLNWFEELKRLVPTGKTR
jgi:dipeptidyl aminopeptidase/acylaminoacyl peptidase